MTDQQKKDILETVKQFGNRIDSARDGIQQYVGFAFSTAIKQTEDQQLATVAACILGELEKYATSQVIKHNNAKTLATDGLTDGSISLELAFKTHEKAKKNLMHYGSVMNTAQMARMFVQRKR